MRYMSLSNMFIVLYLSRKRLIIQIYNINPTEIDRGVEDESLPFYFPP